VHALWRELRLPESFQSSYPLFQSAVTLPEARDFFTPPQDHDQRNDAGSTAPQDGKA
jgi:hypothetical protein